MKRSAFKPRKGKTWKVLNSISKAPHKSLKRFVPTNVLKEVKERSGGFCERIFPGYWIKDENKIPRRCFNECMKQPHHILKRSRGGTHEVSNLIDLCFQCHAWVESHDQEAIKNGLSLPYKGYKP